MIKLSFLYMSNTRLNRTCSTKISLAAVLFFLFSNAFSQANKIAIANGTRDEVVVLVFSPMCFNYQWKKRYNNCKIARGVL